MGGTTQPIPAGRTRAAAIPAGGPRALRRLQGWRVRGRRVDRRSDGCPWTCSCPATTATAGGGARVPYTATPASLRIDTPMTRATPMIRHPTHPHCRPSPPARVWIPMGGPGWAAGAQIPEGAPDRPAEAPASKGASDRPAQASDAAAAGEVPRLLPSGRLCRGTVLRRWWTWLSAWAGMERCSGALDPVSCES